MIQSAYNKPIEVKAPKADLPLKSASSNSKGSSYKPKDLDSALEKNDFESELKSASKKNEPAEKAPKASSNKTKESSESKDTKEAKVSEEGQTEKSARAPGSEAVDTETQPAIFDPEMTKNVDQAIEPKSVEVAPKLSNEEVMKLAHGEVDPATLNAVPAEAPVPMQEDLLQAMLKTPNIAAAGAGVAVMEVAAGSEQNLMSMDDFVAQKNMVKKPGAQNAYGVQKPQVQKIALENGLKQNQVVNELNGQQAQDAQGNSMNSQQFILNMKSEGANAKGLEVAAPVKVFDMSHIKTTDATKIMDQITNYIVQAKAAKEPTIQMRVNHQELGMIDITVQKAGQMNGDAVAINIGTHSLDGKNFFNQNSRELFSHLASSGVSVSDLKVEVPSQTAKNDFDMGGRNQQGSDTAKQFGSEQNQKRHDSDRRQELWKLLDNSEAA
jgi:hypothetical protein